MRKGSSKKCCVKFCNYNIDKYSGMYSYDSYSSLLPNENELSIAQLEFVASKIAVLFFFFSLSVRLFCDGLVVCLFVCFLTNNYRKLRNPCNWVFFDYIAI